MSNKPATDAKLEAMRALLAGLLSVAPKFSAAGGSNRSTSSNGSSFQVLPDVPVSWLKLKNRTGTSIVWKQDNAGVDYLLLDGEDEEIIGITNAMQISVCRLDRLPAQVPVMYRWAR